MLIVRYIITKLRMWSEKHILFNFVCVDCFCRSPFWCSKCAENLCWEWGVSSICLLRCCFCRPPFLWWLIRASSFRKTQKWGSQLTDERQLFLKYACWCCKACMLSKKCNWKFPLLILSLPTSADDVQNLNFYWPNFKESFIKMERKGFLYVLLVPTNDSNMVIVNSTPKYWIKW